MARIKSKMAGYMIPEFSISDIIILLGTLEKNGYIDELGDSLSGVYKSGRYNLLSIDSNLVVCLHSSTPIITSAVYNYYSVDTPYDDTKTKYLGSVQNPYGNLRNAWIFSLDYIINFPELNFIDTLIIRHFSTIAGFIKDNVLLGIDFCDDSAYAILDSNSLDASQVRYQLDYSQMAYVKDREDIIPVNKIIERFNYLTREERIIREYYDEQQQ